MRIHKVLSPPHALPGVLVANKIDLAERVQVVPLVRTAAPGLGDHGAPAGATRLHRGLRLRVRLHTRERSLGCCRSPGRRHAARLSPRGPAQRLQRTCQRLQPWVFEAAAPCIQTAARRPQVLRQDGMQMAQELGLQVPAECA